MRRAAPGAAPGTDAALHNLLTHDVPILDDDVAALVGVHTFGPSDGTEHEHVQAEPSAYDDTDAMQEHVF